MEDVQAGSAATDIVINIPEESRLDFFTKPGMMDPLIQRVRDFVEGFKPDLSTKTSRAAIASAAFKVAKAKTLLKAQGDELAAELKELPKKVDATRKRLREELEALQTQVRKPLTDWEEAEEKRINDHKAAIATLATLASPPAGATAEHLHKLIEDTEAVPIGLDCEEFVAEYAREKVGALKALTEALAKREKYDAEQAELEKLRAEAAERKAQDERDRIAREAAEKAKAEEARKVEQAQAEAAAAVKAAAEREAKIKADAAAEAAKAEAAAEAAKKAAEEQAARHAAEIEAANKRAADAAAQAQRDLEAKQAEEKAAAKKREDNIKHKSKILGEAKDALIAGAGIDEETAVTIVKMIARGDVPHTSIAF